MVGLLVMVLLLSLRMAGVDAGSCLCCSCCCCCSRCCCNFLLVVLLLLHATASLENVCYIIVCLWSITEPSQTVMHVGEGEGEG